MIFTSWNVNGLRSVSTKGFEEWFRLFLPDVIALQEIKATQQDVLALIERWSDLYNVHLNPAEKKGYSGTALLIKKTCTPISIERGIGIPEYDAEGRLIYAEFENIIFLNGYFPNGQRDHGRVEFKLDFSRRVVALAHELHQKTNKEIIIAGDINTAHCEIDLSNPKANSKTTGFLPNERAFIDEMQDGGLTDVFRHFHPGLPDQYTWWTYRGDCRERNIGWRLDYFFATKNLLSRVKSVAHHFEVLGSDHCPIFLEVN
ncbi:MAG: exodeoxyribonuclease III [Bacteriovorax sp.]|nr:exodeoxyribonuclease III [Bacteriovorax sp.]